MLLIKVSPLLGGGGLKPPSNPQSPFPQNLARAINLLVIGQADIIIQYNIKIIIDLIFKYQRHKT